MPDKTVGAMKGFPHLGQNPAALSLRPFRRAESHGFSIIVGELGRCSQGGIRAPSGDGALDTRFSVSLYSRRYGSESVDLLQ